MDLVRMRKCFEKVASNGDEVPLFFYSHLFLTHPETRTMFPVSMMQQRDRLFAALGHIVSKVDDADNLVPYLKQLGRDHRKFGTLSEHYPAVGASLLATLAQFAGDDWTAELEADWTAAYGLVAQVMSEAAEADIDSPPWWNARVISHEIRTLDTAVIRLAPSQPYPFEPGQSLTIETELRPRLWRQYSIANAPRDDGTLDLHVQAMDGGPVSFALVRHLHVGDVVRLGPPLGTMTLDVESDRDLVLVAGGTGLAPLKAIVEQLATLGDERRVDLLVGTRNSRDIYDIHELSQLDAQHEWLSVVLAAPQHDTPELPLPVQERNVVDVLASSGPWRSRDAYVCGSSQLVKAAVDVLETARVPRQRIRMEEFVPSRPSPQTERK